MQKKRQQKNIQKLRNILIFINSVVSQWGMQPGTVYQYHYQQKKPKIYEI